MDFRPELSWEFLSPEQIEQRSIRALRNHVRDAKESSEYYREVLREVAPEDIASTEAYSQLPLTTKETLVDNTDRFTAVPPERIVETVVTSGSTGKPLVFPLTANDLERLAFNEALSFSAAGVRPGDRAQILVSLDRLFIAGMAYYRGLTMLGANTARIGVLPLEMQRHYIELLQPTVVVGVPSFLKKLGAELAGRGFDTKNCSIRTIVCIGESIRTQELELNAIGAALEEMFGAEVHSTYGNTELSVAYCECTARTGGHAHPELVYTEIVDEEGNVVTDGMVGELVATPLGVEGVPLVRYRTGDMTFKIGEQCACGRNSCRIGPILARKSQMIKLRGTKLYPLTITNALDEMEEIRDYVMVLEGDSSLSDRVTLHVAASSSMVEPIVNHLRARARVAVPVLISNEPTLTAMRGNSRKKIRVIDKRK